MPKKRALTSEDLGDAGEARFEALCKEGTPSLIVNRVLKDKSGWDFIVEFPADNSQFVGLDRRSNPISARFQQKTMWVDNDRVKFKLSSLERLAKDPGPAFICVLKYDDDVRCVECYIIHIIDEMLEYVLTELRQHELLGGGALNRKEVDLYPSQIARCIEPTHNNIIEAIAASVDEDVTRYVQRKAEQLQNSGFKASRYDIIFGLPEEHASKLADAFLGESEEISVSHVDGGETRFGIRLPLPGLAGPATLKIVAAPTDTCNLVFSDGRSDAAISRAVFYKVPPDLVFEDNPKIVRCKSKGVEILFRRKSSTITVQNNFPAATTMSVVDWHHHFRILKMVTEGRARVDIRMRGKTIKALTDVPPFTFKKKLDYDNVIANIDALTGFLRKLGYDAPTSLTFKTILDLGRQMYFAVSLFDKKEKIPIEPLALSQDYAEEAPDELNGVYITYVDLGDDLLLWTTHINASKEGDKFNVTFQNMDDLPPEMSIVNRGDYKSHVDEFRTSGVYPLVIYSTVSWEDGIPDSIL
ncbi:hypothetical protein [Methylobacterium sp. 391_Methyba4]|uniref:hypothetical protein n=1 Tax=Methylobacterium sp. 391_Methyba4 TaxID=3038924 RepID=UPI0024202F8B|nr:hypothetical protein [Methylobacterium sp. 391_Methyba4]WFS10371.1 hypothetical protein P9K36_14300 [Methylobacterium sp. 391_Methyba4]